VFTHLSQAQTEHYLREAKRILRPDGLLHTTWFLFDKRYFPMMQDFQNTLFINDVDPSNAIIYDRRWLPEAARAAGLVIRHAIPPQVRAFTGRSSCPRNKRAPKSLSFPRTKRLLGGGPRPCCKPEWRRSDFPSRITRERRQISFVESQLIRWGSTYSCVQRSSGAGKRSAKAIEELMTIVRAASRRQAPSLRLPSPRCSIAPPAMSLHPEVFSREGSCSRARRTHRPLRKSLVVAVLLGLARTGVMIVMPKSFAAWSFRSGSEDAVPLPAPSAAAEPVLVIRKIRSPVAGWRLWRQPRPLER
jgi:hypothetical protein